MSSEKIFTRYNYLLELHNIARRKYYENSYQTNERIINKLSNNYNQTLLDVKNFVDSLTESQKKALNNRLNLYPEDTTYSENHNLSQSGDKPLEDYQITDPHFLNTQKEADFSSDTEESVGNIDDYNNLKGL